MYDLDGNGFITKEEMARIMDSFYKLVGPLVTFSGKKYESPAQLVDEFFDQMDINKDGQIRYLHLLWDPSSPSHCSYDAHVF